MRAASLVTTVVFLIIIAIAFIAGKILAVKPFSTALLVSPTPSSLVSPLPSNMVSPDATTSARVDQMNTPGSVVTAFSDNFLAASPPVSNGDSALKALSLLTQRAQTQIQQKNANNITAGLTQFVGVQNTPDDGLTLGKTIINANNAQVPLTWNYTDRTVTKTFYLYKEQGIWKIDMIK
jgi:hypothetical protein